DSVRDGGRSWLGGDGQERSPRLVPQLGSVRASAWRDDHAQLCRRNNCILRGQARYRSSRTERMGLWLADRVQQPLLPDRCAARQEYISCVATSSVQLVVRRGWIPQGGNLEERWD